MKAITPKRRSSIGKRSRSAGVSSGRKIRTPLELRTTSVASRPVGAGVVRRFRSYARRLTAGYPPLSILASIRTPIWNRFTTTLASSPWSHTRKSVPQQHKNQT